MKTLIVYAAGGGCTHKVAEKMRDELGEDVVLINLKKDKEPALVNYQRVIIGGDVRAGKIQRVIKEFCLRSLEELAGKQLGLFICVMEKDQTARKLLVDAFPEELRIRAKSTAVFSSSMEINRMNIFERLAGRKMVSTKATTSRVDFEAVQQFSRRMDRIFYPFLFLA